jgi:pyocin large subunit-like protein
MISVRAAACAAAFAMLAAGGLSACNKNNAGAAASAGAGQFAGSQAFAADRSAARRPYGDESARPPVPMFHGEPVWSENRYHSAEENAEYHFRRDGQSLGARTLDDFLTKVHHFGDHPPPGTLTLTRANGDKLLYDPKANLFGVFTREGAPRTIMKPREGMAYWTEQKAREAEGGDYRSRSRGGYGRSDSRGGDGGGYGAGES